MTLEEIQKQWPEIPLGKTRDIRNHKIGLLTILYRTTSAKNGQTQWVCKCDCGNYIVRNGSKMAEGKQISCGCQKRYKTINEVGNRYNKLIVLKQADKPRENAGRGLWWLCKCDCGNITIVRGKDLRNGDVQSCGCLEKENQHKFGQYNFIDETNNVYTYLTVIKQAPSKKGIAAWECKCKCGNTIIVRGCDLRNGSVKSCGCLHSLGEQKIITFLQQNNINFKKEYSFIDLVTDKLGHPRFDFAIFDTQGCLKYLIEYQGEQHYTDKGKFGKRQREITDKLKKDYCNLHNIPLYEITYKDNIIEQLQNIIGRENEKDE